MLAIKNNTKSNLPLNHNESMNSRRPSIPQSLVPKDINKLYLKLITILIELVQEYDSLSEKDEQKGEHKSPIQDITNNFKRAAAEIFQRPQQNDNQFSKLATKEGMTEGTYERVEKKEKAKTEEKKDDTKTEERKSKKKKTAPPPKQGVKAHDKAWIEHQHEGEELIDKNESTVYQQRSKRYASITERRLAKKDGYPPLDELRKKPAQMAEVKLEIEGEGSGCDMAVEVFDRRSGEWVVIGAVDNKEKATVTFDYDQAAGPPAYRVTKYHHDDGRIQNDHTRTLSTVIKTGESEIAKDGGTSVRDFKGEADNYKREKDAEHDDISFKETIKKPAKKDEDGNVALDKKHFRPVRVSATIKKDAYKDNDNIALERFDAQKNTWETIMEFPADIEEGKRTQTAVFMHYTGKSEEPKYRMKDMDTGKVIDDFKETESDVEGGDVKQKTRTIKGEFEINEEDDYNDIEIKERLENEGAKYNKGTLVHLGTTEGGGVAGFLKGLASIFGINVADKVTEDDFKLEYKDDNGKWITIAERGDGKNAEAKGINETHEIPLTPEGTIREMRLTTGEEVFNVADVPEGVFKAKSGVSVDPLAMVLNVLSIAAVPFSGGASLALGVGRTLATSGIRAAGSALAKGIGKIASDAALKFTTKEGAKGLAIAGAREVGEIAADGTTTKIVNDGNQGNRTSAHETTAHETSTNIEISGSEGDDIGATVTYGGYHTGIEES